MSSYSNDMIIWWGDQMSLDGDIFKTPCLSGSVNQETRWQPLSNPIIYRHKLNRNNQNYLQKPIKRGTMCKKQLPMCVHIQRLHLCRELFTSDSGRRPPRGGYLTSWWNVHAWKVFQECGQVQWIQVLLTPSFSSSSPLLLTLSYPSPSHLKVVGQRNLGRGAAR